MAPKKLSSQNWAFDEKEQLKKFMMIFGYGR